MTDLEESDKQIVSVSVCTRRLSEFVYRAMDNMEAPTMTTFEPRVDNGRLEDRMLLWDGYSPL